MTCSGASTHSQDQTWIRVPQASPCARRPWSRDHWLHRQPTSPSRCPRPCLRESAMLRHSGVSLPSLSKTLPLTTSHPLCPKPRVPVNHSQSSRIHSTTLSLSPRTRERTHSNAARKNTNVSRDKLAIRQLLSLSNPPLTNKAPAFRQGFRSSLYKSRPSQPRASASEAWGGERRLKLDAQVLLRSSRRHAASAVNHRVSAVHNNLVSRRRRDGMGCMSESKYNRKRRIVVPWRCSHGEHVSTAAGWGMLEDCSSNHACHTAGVAACLKNNGLLEHVHYMAVHVSPDDDKP